MAYKVFSNGDALTGGELNTFLMNQSVISFATTTARDAALTAPLEGQLVWLEDSNKYVYYSGSAWADLITPAAPSFNTNAIINGGFDIWQRGTSFTNPNGTYTADRWLSSRDGSGATITISQQTNTVGDSDNPFFLRFAQTVAGSSGTFNNIEQRIEDVRTFQGQTVTISFEAKSDSSRTVQPVLAQNFGSGGSGTVATLGTNITVNTTWTRYTQTITLPSITGKTIGANNHLAVFMGLASNVVQTLDFRRIQLESGSTATPFRRNANSIQGELAACQRYYWRVSGAGASPVASAAGAHSTVEADAMIKLPVTMRIAPTSVDMLNVAFSTWPGVTYNLSSPVIFGATNSDYVYFYATMSGGPAANTPGYLRLTSTGHLGFSAEL